MLCLRGTDHEVMKYNFIYRGRDYIPSESAAIKATMFGLFLENKSQDLYTSVVDNKQESRQNMLVVWLVLI